MEDVKNFYGIKCEKSFSNYYVVTLSKDTIINNIEYKKDSLIYFYENGNVSCGVLAKYTIINDIECQKDSEISFYENGNVRIGILSKDTI